MGSLIDRQGLVIPYTHSWCVANENKLKKEDLMGSAG